MALISIKDLPQSDALDREAMRSIVGGGSIGPRPTQSDQAKVERSRLIDYPPGFNHGSAIPEKSRR